jgi:putative ABC transport system permease protein
MTPMFGYYLRLGVRQLRKSPVLTGLMVLTLAVGVAASMSTLTVLRAMSADPIPDKSDRLFVALLDIRPDNGADTSPEPPFQLNYRDAVALRDAHEGVHQAVLFLIGPVVGSSVGAQPPMFTDGIAADSDFFAMAETRFVGGAPWTAADDAARRRVAAIREKLAHKLYGDLDPIGRTLRVDGIDYVVVGVVADDWKPRPAWYRLYGGPGGFGGDDQIFVPFETAIAVKMAMNGIMSCPVPLTEEDKKKDEGGNPLMTSQCAWLSLWVELASADDAPAFRDFMAGYVAEQRKLGRFPRPDNQRLYDVNTWLAKNKVVSRDTRLQTYLAFGFLLVCLINTIGLLLAKFSARAGDIGVRRALGASRRAIFQQYLVEAGVIGLAGGIAALGLTRLCLWLIGRKSEVMASLAHLDWTMLGVTVAVGVGSSLIAGLLPTWRACQVQPALQLKSQ